MHAADSFTSSGNALVDPFLLFVETFKEFIFKEMPFKIGHYARKEGVYLQTNKGSNCYGYEMFWKTAPELHCAGSVTVAGIAECEQTY